jgi:exodeoxyribonuclease VIII
MLDLETLGDTHDAAIIEIGAVAFSVEKGIIERFSRVIELESAMEFGVVTPSTLGWWLARRDKPEAQLLTDIVNATYRYELPTALYELSSFSTIHQPSAWFAHATFDFPILANAYNKTELTEHIPFPYRRALDLRTLCALRPTIHRPSTPTLERHRAVDDAEHQAHWAIQLLYNLLP